MKSNLPFLFVACVFYVISKKSLPNQRPWKYTLMFKSQMWGRDPTSFFWMGISRCPSIICWKDCYAPTDVLAPLSKIMQLFLRCHQCFLLTRNSELWLLVYENNVKSIFGESLYSLFKLCKDFFQSYFSHFNFTS